MATARLFSLSSRRLSLLLAPRRHLSTAVPTRFLVPRPSPFPRFNPARFETNLAGTSEVSPPTSETSDSTVTDRPKAPTDMAPLFPGCDYNHWLVIVEKPGGKDASNQKMIDCYIQTLAKVLGSEEEAKKKIYSVHFKNCVGFGCEIDEETSEKLEELPEVLFVLPDSYVDPEHKDYGGELFVDGKIVQRPPERQKRFQQRSEDKPRNSNRTKNVRTSAAGKPRGERATRK